MAERPAGMSETDWQEVLRQVMTVLDPERVMAERPRAPQAPRAQTPARALEEGEMDPSSILELLRMLLSRGLIGQPLAPPRPPTPPKPPTATSWAETMDLERLGGEDTTAERDETGQGREGP